MRLLPALLLTVFFTFPCRSEHGIAKDFVPAPQSAAISDDWSLWHNPAGLGFVGGSISSAAYLYEHNEQATRQHGSLNIAFNVFDHIGLGAGLNTRVVSSELAKQNFGTDLSGILGFSLNMGQRAAFGMSFLKTHQFLLQKNSDWLVSFGMQSRLSSYLAIGAYYEEVNNGFFSAPKITGGFSIRPFGEKLTIGIDGKLVPKGLAWSDGHMINPIINMALNTGGITTVLGAEIPDIKNGFKTPIFTAGIDINFAHVGFGLIGSFNNTQKNYGAGLKIRTSNEIWPSIYEPSNRWVHLDINESGSLVKKPQSFAEQLLSENEHPLAILAVLRRIKEDPRIEGVFLNFAGFSFGMGRAEEWRKAILDLKHAKKEVIVYLDRPSERDYYIASAANKIFMNQNTSISLKMFRATLVYLADTLKKIGIEAQSVSAGSYKTAPRIFTNNRPQKEELEVANNILKNYYDTMIEDVSTARSIDKEKLKQLFDSGEINALVAKDMGLVDELSDQESAIEALENIKEKSLTFFAKYESQTKKQTDWQPSKYIAVVPVVGSIVSGHIAPSFLPFQAGSSGAKDVIDAINQAKNDDNAAAIIVRIDSPGGSAEASHDINRALLLAQKVKPVIASFGDVAASGGYLVAAGCEHIVAEKNTITGSIGVFSLHFSAKDLLTNKIDAFSYELSPIKNPGPSIFRGFSKDERENAQKMVDWYYDNFLDSVSDGLNLEKNLVKQYAEGRVWLGQEAFDRKLIHEIGGFSVAIDKALKLSHMEPSSHIDIAVITAKKTNPLLMGVQSIFRPHLNNEMEPLLVLAKPYLKALEYYRLNNQALARMPFDLDFE